MFVAIQVDGPEMNAYYGRIADLHRTVQHIEIRMTARHKASYICLAERESHHRNIPPNVERVNGEIRVAGYVVRSIPTAYADYLEAWRAAHFRSS